MLNVTGGRRPVASWRTPPGFLERLADAWPAVLDGAVEQAGGDPARVTRDSFLAALREALPGLSAAEDDYARQVSLSVIQQVRGSNVFFPDLDYLQAALLQGRVPPQELDQPRSTLSLATFTTTTRSGTKSLDLFKTTGVTWKIPKGFLNRYNDCNHEVLRRAAALVGARHDGARDVVAGVWGRVDVPTFVEACRQVLGEISADEEEYLIALASEQVQDGTAYIRDLPFLDKCIQNGKTPTSIKGPELLPSIFLNDTTSGKTDGMTLRHTGGRIF
ncbi:hypothetical protein CHLRE_01g017650v5 [Chlamydomonas reinhardtii]|uniref:Uncharacterized protein n=1 Tax=Chlamydomonas reinhardtii TaxID=3055 RepID=A0A2K3E5X9_CHLRE|nr:uncharacterized protein CHLRE_01g017650v5 [Chlamydomonas reinhardtii]XP_042928335.1 uncharacterized protein CHLRE_01g017650v5 [Chlamydomonas reinhardtii]6U42_5E Chain 5E, RIB30 [Chlamydomonas reinhardtii]8GLV_5E Chain 5E, FAP34 [Chlamydomonas reinhardtii]8GLV_Gr Chain Gr, FAP34 [Chlamydomonas reinhardtii]8GLV_OQ Chain OQ, FAP34 [Chlamydomonas reinhardtii]PNW88176.1 hypothetical protein CHLRE_01g017650v5 [Chlamydomonas reinhardtii]PNW88177.1 hypothetical protein CHLRE_01g017650v5 [Chlamydo